MNNNEKSSPKLSGIIKVPKHANKTAKRVGRKSGRPGGPERPLTQRAASECIALCVALLSKMASSSELLEYSSPAKRRKVDGSDHGSIGEALVDPLPGVMAHDSPHDDLEGIRML